MTLSLVGFVGNSTMKQLQVKVFGSWRNVDYWLEGEDLRNCIEGMRWNQIEMQAIPDCPAEKDFGKNSKLRFDYKEEKIEKIKFYLGETNDIKIDRVGMILNQVIDWINNHERE